MTNDGVTIPRDQNGWLLLNAVLGKKVVVRAVDIDKPRDVMDNDGHKVRQTIAEGGVRARQKRLDYSQF